VLDDRQKRIIRRMLATLRDGGAGSITHERMTSDLEAHFLAGEFKEASFRSRFYELWGPLEEAWDTLPDDAHAPLVQGAAAELEAFLKTVLRGAVPSD